MNEQDEKLLKLYLRDARRKKLFFIVIVINFIASILFGVFYVKYKRFPNEVENAIQEEVEINITNENMTQGENISSAENTVIESNIGTQDKTEKTPTEDINQNFKEESKKQETNEKINGNKQRLDISNESEEKTIKEKPANKDFLFTDGYTMDNVTQAAQNYLKSYNFSGKCVPIKDSEGIYLGMRVIFY